MNPIDLLARRIPLSRSEISLLIETAPSRYKVHSIEKRHGRGTRTIAQPTAEVKLAQVTLLKLLKKVLPIHDCAKAYRDGLSIKDHAAPHAANSYLLKVDFKDFFPSITSADLRLHLRKHSDLDEEWIRSLERVFFWRQKITNRLVMAIGAPSSPWLSNSIMHDFDEALTAYCQSTGITYTRYADDLALSTNTPDILRDALVMVKNICADLKYPRLTVNDEKTVFTSKKHNRTLTGLVLANDGSTSIGRTRKREIRALAHHFDNNALDPEQVANLRGLLAFTYSIDPDFNSSVARMIGVEKYNSLMQPGKTKKIVVRTRRAEPR